MKQFELLRSARFLPLFITQFLGAFNDNVFKNGLVIFIAFTMARRLGADSGILVAMAGGVFIFPFFIFSATAGQIADRYEKAMLIRHIKTAEIVIMGFAAVGFSLGSIWFLMLTLFLMGAQSTFFGPLKYGILPQHLRLSELTGGNGLVQAATYLAILFGTILGGVAMAVHDAGPWLVSAAVLVIAVAGRVASHWIPEAAPSDATLKVDWNIFRETLRIMAAAMENRFVFVAILAISWFWFCGLTFLSLVPTYARDVLHGNAYVATLFMATFSVGIGVGSLLCERFSGGEIEPGLVPFGAAGLALFSIDLYLAPVPGAGSLTALAMLGRGDCLRILLDLCLIGMFGGIYIVPLFALVQHRCEPAHRARIIAANNIVNALYMVVSALAVMGLLKAGQPPQRIFLYQGLATLVVTGIIFFICPEYLRRSLVMLRSRRNPAAG